MHCQLTPLSFSFNTQLRLTLEVAVMKIQFQWRRFMTKRLLRNLARKDFKRVLDPVVRSYCYWTPDGQYLRRTPYLLGEERWEDKNMMLWTMQEVMVWIRRLGLKQYVPGASIGGKSSFIVSIMMLMLTAPSRQQS